MDEVEYSGNFTLCELDMSMLNGPWLRKVMETGAGGWLRKGTIWDLLISIESHEFDKPDMKPEHDIHQHTYVICTVCICLYIVQSHMCQLSKYVVAQCRTYPHSQVGVSLHLKHSAFGMVVNVWSLVVTPHCLLKPMVKVKPVAAPLEAHEVRKMEKEVPEVTAGMASCCYVFFSGLKKSFGFGS